MVKNSMLNTSCFSNFIPTQIRRMLIIGLEPGPSRQGLYFQNLEQIGTTIAGSELFSHNGIIA